MIYFDNSSTAVKSEQADLVVSAVERFAQLIPLNLQEIFIWYFEQKGVDNPERFLGVNNNGLNKQTTSPLLSGEGQGEWINPQVGPAMPDTINLKNQLSQNSKSQPSFDLNALNILSGKQIK